MYRVTKDGKVLTIASNLIRVTHQSNGVNIIDPNGPGVVVGGTLYNLPGYEYVQVEEINDVRQLIDEIAADSSTMSDIRMALVELASLIPGGTDNG